MRRAFGSNENSTSPRWSSASQHNARRQNFRQHDRLRVGIFRINQNQRHAGAVVAVQFRRDGVGKMRVIAEQRDGVQCL